MNGLIGKLLFCNSIYEEKTDTCRVMEGGSSSGVALSVSVFCLFKPATYKQVFVAKSINVIHQTRINQKESKEERHFFLVVVPGRTSGNTGIPGGNYIQSAKNSAFQELDFNSHKNVLTR